MITPGEWRAESGNAEAEHPLFVTAPDKDGFRPWTDDDARLIAAAPELLEVLKHCFNVGNSLEVSDLEMMRAVIAKAEGRP